MEQANRGPFRRRPPTVKDVAERAGVSWMTVSNVVNQKPSVRPATRQKVEAAISELGYRKSRAGQQLRSGRTNILALALPDLRTPYFAALAHEIIGVAEERGYTVLIAETKSSPERERHAARGFDTQLADGVILRPDSLDSERVLDSTGQMPLVLLGEGTREVELDHVTLDNAGSGREATAHILSLSRRAPLFLGAREEMQFGPGWQRFTGFRSALEEAGLDAAAAPPVDVRSYGRAPGAAAVEDLLRRGVTFDALVCATDLIAIGAMQALRRAGAAIPDDVAVLGWDGTLEGEFANPSLTTIGVDISRVAREAVAMMIRRIEDPGADPEVVEVPQELIIRESTAGPAGPAPSPPAESGVQPEGPVGIQCEVP